MDAVFLVVRHLLGPVPAHNYRYLYSLSSTRGSARSLNGRGFFPLGRHLLLLPRCLRPPLHVMLLPSLCYATLLYPLSPIGAISL